MAIKSVTTENIAEYVASRPNTAEISSSADLNKVATEVPSLGKPVIKAGEEKLEGLPPDPGTPTDEERKSGKPKPGSMQERLEKLGAERAELDEAFQAEYEQRLRLEGELNALRSREAKPVEPPKPELGPEPDPTTYQDQKLFLKDWGEWQRKKARAEFQAEEALRRQQAEIQRKQQEMVEKVDKAKKDFPDYLQVLKAAEAQNLEVPLHIKAAFEDSEWGAHLAYYLMKDSAELRRIYALPPAKALLELGKIESAYADRAESKAKPPEIPPEPKQIPPMAKLGESAGMIPKDLSQPMNFKDYRKARLEEIRGNRRR